MMIERPKKTAATVRALKRYPVVAILGARQVGKSTLAREVAKKRGGVAHFFDLEDPIDRRRLADPGLTLRSLRGLVVLDEVQRLPEVFPILRVLADRRPRLARFLVLGSASPSLLAQASESLAGRIHSIELDGFDLEEVGVNRLDQLWRRGGFPRAFLARSEAASVEWRDDFVETFLERDIPALGVKVAATTLRRFWTMLAHYHGQLWNGSELARALGTSEPTVRRYLDLLTDTFVIRQLQPWHENMKKRQVKSPKIYLRDVGLLHALLGIRTRRDLEGHPKVGASWEGFLVDQVVRHLGAGRRECHFWATHTGAEIDLLVTRGRRRMGFEFKRTEAPKITKSMHVAMEDLGLAKLTIVHAGEVSFDLSKKIRAVAAREIFEEIRPLPAS